MSVFKTSCILDRTTGKPVCPLQSAEVTAFVDLSMAEVTLIQNYINTGIGNIEALYIFPLPHKAVVTGFKVKIGLHEVTGIYKEKEEAFQQYDEAIRRGNSGFLLESHRPDIFQVSLGNIATGESISVSITYLEEPKCVDNELRWVLPTVVAPRYIPGMPVGAGIGAGTVPPTDRVPDADFITPPVGNAPYSLKLTASLKGIQGLKKITSPSHPIEIQLRDGGFSVTLAKEAELLNRDFVLCAVADCMPSNRFVMARAGKEAFGEVTVTFTPDDVPQQKNYDYTFMIDVSGSMSGNKLDQAKKALSLSLRNLIEGDRFNIVAFESAYSCYSSATVPYTQENLEKADQWVQSLRPLGGTEIYQPLRFVLEGYSSSAERIIFLFTDGQVGNEKEIIKLVKKHNNSLHLFTFGIDTAVNKYFIDSLAEAGNGMPEYVYPGERVDDKVIRQFSRIHQPFMKNVEILRTDGVKLDTAPAIPTRLYGDEEYTFRFKDADVTDSLILKGEVENQKTEVHLPLNGISDARLLSLKWAKDRIRMLENSLGYGNQRRDELAKKEIITLSEKYGVLSTLTSLVAVYEREHKEHGTPETIVVPVASPDEWQLSEQAIPVCFAYSEHNIVTEKRSNYSNEEDCLESPKFFKRLSRRTSSRKERGIVASAAGSGIFDSFRSMKKPEMQPSQDTPSMVDVSELIREAAQLQKADGSFGEGSPGIMKTSCFVIAMLLLRDHWKPYRIQLVKAGKVLLAKADGNPLFKAVAINMLGSHKLIAVEDAAQYVAEIRSRMDAGSNELLNTFIAGEHDILKKEIPMATKGDSLAVALLKMVIS